MSKKKLIKILLLFLAEVAKELLFKEEFNDRKKIRIILESNDISKMISELIDNEELSEELRKDFIKKDNIYIINKIMHLIRNNELSEELRKDFRKKINDIFNKIEILIDYEKKDHQFIQSRQSKIFFNIKNIFENISPKTWENQEYRFGDTIDAHYDEVKYWEKKNLKFVAYLITGWELLQFSIYFFRKMLTQSKEINKEKTKID